MNDFLISAFSFALVFGYFGYFLMDKKGGFSLSYFILLAIFVEVSHFFNLRATKDKWYDTGISNGYLSRRFEEETYYKEANKKNI
ncbi:hypothetical protein [Bacillus yapensis]|nr:hypothetical protein [Bacillus yapensis]